jgi:hypothetical protein
MNSKKSLLVDILVDENESLKVRLKDAYSANALLKKDIIIIQIQYDELVAKLETTNPDILNLKNDKLIDKLIH